MLDLRRRDFITLLGGGAAAWPVAARAQQNVGPIIGFLHSQTSDGFPEPLREFRQALRESGYVEGDNLLVEYRWAQNRSDLRSLAGDLVSRGVAVLAAMDTPSALAAKEVIAPTAVVFMTGIDPVAAGLVASLARPGGNLTGVNFLSGELTAKRLGIMRELIPGAARFAVLLNTIDVANSQTTMRDVELAARPMGLQIRFVSVSTSQEIHAAFASFAREPPDALLIGSGPYFYARRVQLALLAARHGIPTMYTQRQYVEAGGLFSYGANVSGAWRQVGVYIGRILKGAKPADLPVVQASKFELVINADAARLLDITVPPSLLSLADEVIE
jgi:putative tryptophan/tyrosine transport system substrate-binding protein